MRVVIDTNVFVSRHLKPQGVVTQVFELWRQGAFELVVSEAVLVEYRRVLLYPQIRQRHQLSTEQVNETIEDIREFAYAVQPTQTITVITRDPDDNKFLECALEGGAEYIVSGDKDLLSLKSYQGVYILSPAAFLTIFSSGGW